MIRVAILGAGIGREHLAAYQRLPSQFTVSMLVDQDMDRASGLVSGDTIRIESDIKSAIIDPDIDVIDVCLPPHLHVEVCLAALAHGKHVICEKPLTTSLADVDRLEVAAAKADRHVFPVFQYRWGPSLAQMMHLIDLGLTGRRLSASLETHWLRGADYYAVPWRGTWAGEQGGAVLGHAIHNHDLLCHIFGPVDALGAFTTTRVNDIETEDCAAIAFEMADGALATSNITLGAAFDRTRLRFVFEKLTATSGDAPYAPGADPWRFEARDPVFQSEIDHALQSAPKPKTGFDGFLTEVSKAIEGKQNTAITLAAGRKSVELVTAIYAAARTGHRVNLPLPTSHPMYAGWQP